VISIESDGRRPARILPHAVKIPSMKAVYPAQVARGAGGLL
jgi:hypothetical protein